MSFKTNSTGVCPHCGITNRFESVPYKLLATPQKRGFLECIIYNSKDSSCYYGFTMAACTSCGEPIISLDEQVIFPFGGSRLKAPNDVPEEIASDYNEAISVENISPKAAGALARRCLQNILHDNDIKADNLFQEIDLVITSLPTDLAESIDAIRVIGNYSAHPIKSTNTGGIVEVELEEVAWTLDSLQSLFDHFYVRPAKIQAQKKTLNLKLEKGGKQPLK